MATAKDFTIGERVVHISHGLGNVDSFDLHDDLSIFIEFDVEPEGWDKILDVSVSCLKKVEKQPIYKIKDKFERKNFEYEIVAIVKHDSQDAFVYMVKQREIGQEDVEYKIFDEDTFALYENVNK